ncbi:MAG TPA: hypothetical protein VFO21_08185 [Vicinamibacterales bacterium]|nr:hypothetical protein [Vicinamibacterales bacterium]
MEQEVELDDPFAAEHGRIYTHLREMDLSLDTAALEKLTRLVARHDAAFRTWREYPGVQRNLRVDAEHGEASRRVLIRKVAKALDAVDEVLDYVAKISRGNELIGRIFKQIAIPHLKSARQSLAAIPTKSGRLNRTVAARLTPFGKSFASDPTSVAREELLEFFAKTCKLRPREADRNIALVGNALGWWNVKIDDEWLPMKDRRGARGSNAIRKSRVRSQRRDASRKTR